MQNKLHDIQKIYITDGAKSSPVARRAMQLFPEEKITILQGESGKTHRGTLSAEQFNRSKKELLITNFKGQFFKRCPGARPGITCCNYFVLNLGEQCNMNCSYCYLQSFINSPIMKIYANLDQALSELREIGTELKDQPLRVGTGEVIDSLSLDELTLYSRELIEFFRDYPKWRLEFKTKSSNVDQFLYAQHAGNIIVSFSINPQNIIESEEHGTASLSERLYAAKKARDQGYLISFHIDPMIYHVGWQESYASLVQDIVKIFKPQDIPVMSIGALRFQPEQRHLMRERFGLKSLVLQAEVFSGRDGKFRYDQKLREEMYDFVRAQFLAHSAAWKMFLCMESPESWLSSFGQMPKQAPGLYEIFDHNVIKKVIKAQENKDTVSI